jgi:nitroreductase
MRLQLFDIKRVGRKGKTMISPSVPVTQLKKDAETEYAIHDLLRGRWSPRIFADRPVEAEKLGSLLEAARWSASSRNEQPWRFIVATKENPEAYQTIYNCLMEGNQRWASTAPVLMIGVATRNFAHNDQPNNHAWYDLGQAVANLSIQAMVEGLYVHQMGGFRKDQARESLQIPETHEPVVAIAIGYLGDLSQAPEDLQQREQARRTRKSLNELVFNGKWGTPLFA